MATEEKAPAESHWAPVVFIVLLIAGLFALLWERGGLKEFNAQTLFVPPPTDVQYSATSSTNINTDYANQQPEQVYSTDPNSTKPPLNP